MPIFAYRCRACGTEFQTLVRSSETPVCEACHSTDLDQQLSLIAKPGRSGAAGTETRTQGEGIGCCACGEGVCPALAEG